MSIHESNDPNKISFCPEPPPGWPVCRICGCWDDELASAGGLYIALASEGEPG